MKNPRSIYDIPVPKSARKESVSIQPKKRIIQPNTSRTYSKSPKRPVYKRPLAPLPPPIDA